MLVATEQTAKPGTEGFESTKATDSTAGQEQMDLLSQLEQLLNAKNVQTSIIHRVGLRLHGIRTDLFPRTDRVELVAYSRGGWEVATVTLGERSGVYMVSLPTVRVGCQPVNKDQPHAVVDLILAALPKEKAAACPTNRSSSST